MCCFTAGTPGEGILKRLFGAVDLRADWYWTPGWGYSMLLYGYVEPWITLRLQARSGRSLEDMEDAELIDTPTSAKRRRLWKLRPTSDEVISLSSGGISDCEDIHT